MASSFGHVFKKAECKFCHDQIALNSLDRHEAKCEHASPEERAGAKQAREWAQNRTDRRKDTDKPAPKKWKHTYAKCEFCGDQIDTGRLTFHQKMCKDATPEHRERKRRARISGKEAYHEKKNGKHLDEPVAPNRERKSHHAMHPLELATRHATATMNSNGKPLKPMKITMVVDEDNVALAVGRAVLAKLPEVLELVLPGLTINDLRTK